MTLPLFIKAWRAPTKKIFQPSYQETTSSTWFHYKYDGTGFPITDHAKGNDLTLLSGSSPDFRQPAPLNLNYSIKINSDDTTVGVSTIAGTTFGATAAENFVTITALKPGKGYSWGEEALFLYFQGQKAIVNIGFKKGVGALVSVTDDNNEVLRVKYPDAFSYITEDNWHLIATLWDRSSTEVPQLIVDGVSVPGEKDESVSTVDLFSDMDALTFQANNTFIYVSANNYNLVPLYIAETWAGTGLTYTT